jgi:hypothetical protein
VGGERHGRGREQQPVYPPPKASRRSLDSKYQAGAHETRTSTRSARPKPSNSYFFVDHHAAYHGSITSHWSTRVSRAKPQIPPPRSQAPTALLGLRSDGQGPSPPADPEASSAAAHRHPPQACRQARDPSARPGPPSAPLARNLPSRPKSSDTRAPTHPPPRPAVRRPGPPGPPPRRQSRLEVLEHARPLVLLLGRRRGGRVRAPRLGQLGLALGAVLGLGLARRLHAAAGQGLPVESLRRQGRDSRWVRGEGGMAAPCGRPAAAPSE